MQYGNAFLRGFQAAALKPADFFGNDDVLYLMEDMATGEIRLSILWEWLHKGATLSDDDAASGVRAGDLVLGRSRRAAARRGVRQAPRGAAAATFTTTRRQTTLPIAREIVRTYLTEPVKAPWYIDLLNVNLNNHDLEEARRRIAMYMNAFRHEGIRITANLDF